MNIRIIGVCLLFLAICLTSCYEDYIRDYDTTTAGFAISNPLRTVISERDMPIYVGVSLGGKREVNMDDWATFELDENLLEGTGLTILPDNYYTLSNPNKFTVRKENLPVADVRIDFTDAFYEDENCLKKYFALPFRVLETSMDEIREGGETSIVAIKYVSSFSGTYYVVGTRTEVDAKGNISEEAETIEYGNSKDIIKSSLCECVTLGKRTIIRPGISDDTSDDNGISLKLTIDDEIQEGKWYNVNLELANGEDISLISASGKYILQSPDYTFNNSGEEACPEIELEYLYEQGGIYYKVSEKLVLRRDPLNDLRVETW